MEEDTWLTRLQNRFEGIPFLNLLLRDRLFRIALAVFLLLLIAVPVSFLKIWRTTAEDIRPEIKVSVLDLIKTWSLRRAAVQAAAKGDQERAIYCYEAAAAHNLGDVDVLRGYLQFLQTAPPQRQLARNAMVRGLWLLHLTQTNVSDLTLFGRVLERLGSPEDLISMLQARRGKMPPDLEFLFAKALAETGQTKEFEKEWPSVRDTLRSSLPAENWELVDRIYAALNGSTEQRGEALAWLKKKAKGPPPQVAAARSLVGVAERETDPNLGLEALALLKSSASDRLLDHTRYWRLLKAAGQTEAARTQARGWTNTPANLRELFLLVEARTSLGLREEALQACRDAADRGESGAEMWLAYGQLLIELRRWDQLKQVSARMRVRQADPGVLDGISYFLEGRAELGLGQEENAHKSFLQAAQAHYTNPQYALVVAHELLKFRHPKEAQEILHRNSSKLSQDQSYWLHLFEAADQQQDTALMRAAAEKAYALSPENLVVINNYAATLLILREKPDLAAKLTLTQLARNPNAIESVVNHAAALLIGYRTHEAETLLAKIRPETLNPDQLNLFRLDQFDLAMQKGLKTDARALAEKIQTNRLYPPQRVWFSNAVSRLASTP